MSANHGLLWLKSHQNAKFWTAHDLNYSFMVLKGLFEPTLRRSNLVLDFDQSTHIKLVCSNFIFFLQEMSGILNQGNRSIVKWIWDLCWIMKIFALCPCSDYPLNISDMDEMGGFGFGFGWLPQFEGVRWLNPSCSIDYRSTLGKVYSFKIISRLTKWLPQDVITLTVSQSL